AGNSGTFITDPPLGNSIENSTIVGHANATQATTLGAVRYANTPAFGGTLTAEGFSSLGGTPIIGDTLRHKPDLMAPNGVNTSVSFGALDSEMDGIPNFFGTSAAAPHAAGVAALLFEAQSSFGINPPINIRQLLNATAIDMNSPGFDFTSGYGFISAYNALAAIANPIPILDNLNLDNLNTEIYQPGDIEFTLI
ncbi:MAG: S8 family serine peptidase, partial [Planctomycetaceae bacterium]|nr:S8 family serine peptidase [Planctomycetaceae bacterium]